MTYDRITESTNNFFESSFKTFLYLFKTNFKFHNCTSNDIIDMSVVMLLMQYTTVCDPFIDIVNEKRDFDDI